jgi:flagellar biosynthetic protein FliR
MLFFLIAMRMFGFISFNPVIGRKEVPTIAKNGLALVLSILVYSAESGTGTDFTVDSSLEFGILLIKELIVGFLLGLVLELLDMVFTFAGSVMDFQMGISMAQVYDPQTGVQVAMTGKILQIYYLLIFFAVDGHLALMKIILTAGELVPYGQVGLSTQAGELALDIFYDSVVLAIKLAFPIIAFEFILEVVVGILMKINPQVNIFILSIQLRLLCGFIMMIILVDPIQDFVGTAISQFMKYLTQILKLMGP